MTTEEEPASKSKQAWNEVGDKFSNLGDEFKKHQKTEGDEPHSGEAVKEAFDAVTSSLERFVSSLGSAMKDEDVQQQAKAAATSIVDALGVTVEDLGRRAEEGVLQPHRGRQRTAPEDGTTAEEAEAIVNAASEEE